ncbi:MAG: anti-sigma factor [Actinobacteria bacterium]|nr:anti-sigma factor [Actinomycetota bacterium]
MDNRHEDIRPLVGAYVIGAVPQDEMPALRSHILTCDDCMAEAEGLSDVVSLLTLSVAPVTPPAGFHDRVLARVTADRPPSDAAAPAPKRSRLNRFSYAAVALCVILLTVFVVDSRRGPVGDEATVDLVLQTDGGLDLSGRGDAVAKLVASEDGGAIFGARGLDMAPAGRTYQLWLMDGDCASPTSPTCTITSAGTFQAGADGTAVLRTPRSIAGVERTAITLEPQGGSSKPTTALLIISA